MMKTITLFTAILLSGLFGFAQEKIYTSEMAKGVAMIDTMKTPQGFAITAQHFELMHTNNITQWLPAYYAAYCNLLSGVRGSMDEESKDDRYDTAMKWINKADTLSPNNSEILTLKAYVIFMKMAVYPNKRAMAMIPQSNQLLDKALSLNADNPRAYLLKGQNLYYTPEAFGGSKTQAKEMLMMAKTKFEAEQPKSFEPRWGKSRVAELLKTF
jgi:tetratricopeptide (TPR) repeat protein